MVPPRLNPPVPDKYDATTRGVLILGGLAFVAVGFWLWIWPVNHSEPAPASAKCTDAAACIVKVDDAPALLLSSLVVFGALVTLVGVNNRRITKFAGPGGISFETAAPAAEDKAKEKATEKAKGLSAAEQAAAKLLAATEARGLTYQYERALGRPLTSPEIEGVADDAASKSVAAVKADQAIT
jgi:hypothetical protein